MRTRLALYRAGVLKTHRIGAPVISVGNITTGGTGKTPLVEWLARSLARDGRRVCVLTRGYGRVDARRRVLVSDGVRVLASAREGGDEPRLLGEKLLGVAAVISDADRVAAARWALANLHSEAFILDDGFQHLRIERDLDIVTIDAAAPWGGGQLLPRGRLREPREHLQRAGCIVITRAEMASNLGDLRAEIERWSAGRVPVFTSRVRTWRVLPLGAETLKEGLASEGSDEFKAAASSEFAGDAVRQPVAAFCAIGNARAFFAHLRSDGYTLNYTRAFPDHYFYTQDDIEALTREAEKRGALALLTTAKDAVKLQAFGFGLPVYVVEIKLEFDGESELLGHVREALRARKI